MIIVYTTQWDLKNKLVKEYKMGNLYDRNFIKYFLGEYKNHFLKVRREFMKNLEIEVKKEKKSRAEELRERRKKQTLVQFIATPKAEENLKKLCENTGLNKTQVINKLLEEQEQLSLFK